jgi:hypothetical protein
MLTKSFPLVGVDVDCTLQRKCETCSLWQPEVRMPNSDRCRCACPVPDSVTKNSMYQNYTHPTDGEWCHFWHPRKVNKEADNQDE